MSDVFQVLRRDHETVESLLERLDAERTPRTRSVLVERLVIEESQHETVEEEYFWPAVREFVSGGDALADEATEQEQRAKEILDRLDDLVPGDERFEELLTAFARDAREHIAFEETRVWPRLRREIDARQAVILGNRLARGKALAPTHPHPGIAPEPGILKASGPMTAAADRIRDAATGRGRERR